MRTVILKYRNGSSQLFPQGEKLVPQRYINILRARGEQEFKSDSEQMRVLNLARVMGDPIAYFPSMDLGSQPFFTINARKVTSIQMRDPKDSWDFRRV